MRNVPFLTAAVSGAVALAGGLIGLGGAELRLPFIVGVLGIAVRQAVPANLAVSLATVAAALPPRLWASDPAGLVKAAPVAFTLAAGAMAGAWFGAGHLRRLSTRALTRLVGGLLVVLGLVMLVEAVAPLTRVGLIPEDDAVRIVAGLAIGALIGAFASLLSVAGGEIIIPVLVVGFGLPIADAGTLSLLISCRLSSWDSPGMCAPVPMPNPVPRARPSCRLPSARLLARLSAARWRRSRRQASSRRCSAGF